MNYREANVEHEVGRVTVEMPYDRELIEELKAEIPVNGRKWNGSRKTWEFLPSYWDDARRIIEQFFVIVD